MFNKTVLLRFAFFIESLSKRQGFYTRFVFDEITNDLVTLHGIPYDQNDFRDATDHNITIVESRKIGRPQCTIIDLLQQIIHFKQNHIRNDQNWQKFVLIGLYDMNLMTYSHNFPYLALHPTMSGSHQLFVVNMKMIGTPTYFLEMFDVYLWIAYLTSLILIGVLSTLGMYLLQRYTTIRFNYLTWFSMITNQGGEENTRLIFPKVLLVSLSVISIIFHGSFGAFLSSYLAIRNPDLPFTNLDGLIKIPDYTICSHRGTTSYKYINDYIKSDVAIRHRVNNKNCPKDFKQKTVIAYHENYKNYCPSDKIVFFLQTAFENSNDKCPAFNIIALNEKYGKFYDTFMISPGFKYREQFNRGLIRLRTAGFIKRFELNRHKVWQNNERRLEHLEHDPTIDFHQTQIILLIPVIGIILGIIILMIELLIKNC